MDIRELGCVPENRGHCDYTQESFYYAVTAAAKAVLLICGCAHDRPLRKFLQARVKEYKNSPFF